MDLEMLERDWKKYVWETYYDNSGKLACSIILKDFYLSCERVDVCNMPNPKDNGPALVFVCKFELGLWEYHRSILRCDAEGNCYYINSYDPNLENRRWIKDGRFVRIRE